MRANAKGKPGAGVRRGGAFIIILYLSFDLPIGGYKIKYKMMAGGFWV